MCAQVNANGVALKKKQLWTLEAFGDSTDAVCLRSHLDKYLSVDQVCYLLPNNRVIITYFFIGNASLEM